MTKDNAELIKRARYFHADDLGGLVLPLADALELAEALLDSARGERDKALADWVAVSAERDAALAVIERVRAVDKRARPSVVSGNLIADGNALRAILKATS